MPSLVENRDARWWVANPVDPDENFADKWNEKPVRREAFLAWMKNAQDDFGHVSQQASFTEAAKLLMPALGRGSVSKVASNLGITPESLSPVRLSPQLLVPALGDTRHRLAPSWPERLVHKANVTGGVYLQEHAKKKLWDITDRSVPKNVWLRFSVKTNSRAPYEAWWQVVNTGCEAADAKQLRGDFYPSKGGSGVRWERTAYTGTHWVEAFIIKDGICVARSGPKYVKIRG